MLTIPHLPPPLCPGSIPWADYAGVTTYCLPQVSVYQVLEKDKLDTPGGKKLLAARLVSLQTSGWEVFAITPAVSHFSSVLGSIEGILGVHMQEVF